MTYSSLFTQQIQSLFVSLSLSSFSFGMSDWVRNPIFQLDESYPLECNPRYLIDFSGNIWSTVSHKQLKPWKNNYGYLKVCLWTNGKMKRYYIHRLLAETFVENPDPVKFKQVDHINRNHEDNNPFANLRWVSTSHNQRNRKYKNKHGRRGIYKHNGKYAAEIQGPDSKRIRLGHFATREEAGNAYDAKAIELFGDFAYKEMP